MDDIPVNMVTANREEHAFLRRQLAHGFSDRSMQAQETIIATYMDKLILRLRETVAKGNNTVNMRDWYAWTTFDVIGDRALGDSFKCLEATNYHPWVKLFTGFFKEQAFLVSLTAVGLRAVGNFLARHSGALRNRKQHHRFTEIKVKERMELGSERLDLVEGLIKKKADIVSLPTHLPSPGPPEPLSLPS